MKSILDRDFKYTPAAATDLKKKFAQIRKQQAAQATATATKVTTLPTPERKK
jgi:hypothetical protein